MLAPLDLSAKILFPVTVSGYLRSTGTLQQNQKNIAEAVTVEFRHGTEICGIPLTVEQFRDTRFHLVGDFLHLFHSFLIAYLSPPPVEMRLILRHKKRPCGRQRSRSGFFRWRENFSLSRWPDGKSRAASLTLAIISALAACLSLK